MTVRWKPLLILSGLFFVVAVVGVIAMAWTLVPKSAQGVLKQARAAAAAGRFEDAEIYFKQALQFEPKSGPIHEEFADLYRDWARSATADRQEALHNERTDHLVKAVKFDRAAKGPRRELLAEAMAEDSPAEAAYWAKEMLKVDAENTDAHYVLAFEELETPAPNVPEVKRHLKVLEERSAPPIRVALIRARLAQATGDDKTRDAAFSAAHGISLPADASAIDQVARVRLEAVEIQAQADRSKLEGKVTSLLAHVRPLVQGSDEAPGRVARLSQLLDQTQRSLIQGPRGKGSAQAASPTLIDAIEAELDAIFKKALVSKRPDFQLYLAYADHLRFRQQRDRCLEVSNEALRQPAASRPTNLFSAMRLHAVAAEMALSRQDDAKRFEKAMEHVQALLASSETRFQGLGHLFQGAIDLEQSGIVRTGGATTGPTSQTSPTSVKLRSSALGHLKLAAAQLPSLAEAQARYGVALVLSQEQGLGRQYLQNALRLGNLEPQYQFWAAWTILQAGYPEEAEPILDSLFRQLAEGRMPAELEGTLHQISGEVYQARRGPGDLERAAREFEKAAALGQGRDQSVLLRQAQIDVQLGRNEEALARIARLRQSGQGGPAAENLAVLIHEDLGKKDEARRLLREARAQFPQSGELAGLDAAIRTKDGKPAEADRLLQEFLAQVPDNVTLTLMRAQILAESLKQPKEARALLLSLAERCDNSAPLVQVAQLDLEQEDYRAAGEVIAKIRSRWKEAATCDILEGQLALKRGNISAARAHFAEALKKDPDNKIVQFWKARLDGRSGSVAEAVKTLEGLVKSRPSKEVDSGVSLLSAAQSALAGLALQTANFDDAIRRFEQLKRCSESGTLSRVDRWQLITAYVAKNQWPQAKRELAAILNDAKHPPSDDERVRGANLYWQEKEEEPALAQLEYVLGVNPTNPAAVVVRSNLFLLSKKYDEAAGLLRKAIELTSKKPEKPPAVFYLMLAAVENEKSPANSAVTRAREALDQGLAIHPDSVELMRAEFVLLSTSGDPKGAMALVETRAKQDPRGVFRRLMVDLLREQRDYEKAAVVLGELVKESPEDENLAAALAQSLSLQAGEAAAAGNLDRQRELDQKTRGLIADFRKKFPANTSFLETECDLAARNGDLERALALTREIDQAAPSSPSGPLIRARLFARLDKGREVVRAYGEALDRNPAMADVRILLAQELVKLREYPEALRQARAVLATSPGRADAVLLEATALAQAGTTPAEKAAAQQAAAGRLEAAISGEPRLLEAYHALAEIEQARGRRSEAVAVLERDLKANPRDSVAVAKLIQILAGRGADGRAAEPADVQRARRLAEDLDARDKDGSLVLAAGVGFHRAGQLDLALPFSEEAARKLNTPVAHLNLGDLLLSLAESQGDPARARPLFERANAEYDLVIQAQPAQVEAINNKAWVLHSYLGRSSQAMELMQGLLKRVSADALPGEFFDTLGAVHEALGRKGEAEQSYLKGLDRSPDHPVLNYHFGKLLASDRGRNGRARSYLAKALAGRDQLSPSMVRDAELLVRQLGPGISGN
jgi:tetratricopeptide (TPR) repeat protein